MIGTIDHGGIPRFSDPNRKGPCPDGGRPAWLPVSRVRAPLAASFLLLVIFALTACQAGSGGSNKIAFASTKDAQDENIYIIDPDGSNENRLTYEGRNSSPAWSPDAKKIAFVAHRDGNSEIYIMNADGSDQTRLTDTGGNSHPLWSPNGDGIAFQCEKNICVINPDGSDLHAVAFNASDAAWSPDGTKLAFKRRSGFDGQLHIRQIHIMDVTNGDETALTDISLGIGVMTWLPDGERIAFVENEEELHGNHLGDIYVMHLDGSNRLLLVDRSEYDGPIHDLAWSPDGQKFVVSAKPADRSSRKSLVVDVWGADGTNRVDLSESAEERTSFESDPLWSPDGKRVLFRSFKRTREGRTEELYIVDADGSNRQRLTSAPLGVQDQLSWE